MRFGPDEVELDPIDRHILSLLQENCRLRLAEIGEHVGLSAPSVNERVRKLEESGVIMGYHAHVDARRLGLDVAAFIGVSIEHQKAIARFEREIDSLEDVLECHHVTGAHTCILKVKTANTHCLEDLISRLRSMEGVVRTETMVVLSTQTERSRLPLEHDDANAPRRARRNGERPASPGRRPAANGRGVA